MSKLLEVSGLLSNSQRSLSVEYEIASVSLGELPSLSGIFIVIALFIIVGVLGIITGAIYLFFKK